MSFLDAIFGSTPESTGKNVLTGYYNEAIKFPNFTYRSFDSWLAYLDSRINENFAKFVGELVESVSASSTVAEARERLVQLANSSGGEATIPQLTASAGGRGDTVNWIQGVQEVTVDTVEDVSQLATETLQDIGEGVTDTMKLVKYLPWILGAGAALYIFVLAKGHGKAVGRIADAAADRIKRS